MTTDQDRAFAAEQASLIEANHVKHGSGHLNNHVASTLSFYETTRRGILTECAFGHDFNLSVRTDIDHRGDGGADFILPLRTDDGVKRFPVDVKSKSVRTTWDALRRSGTHLRVLQREVRPTTIYVCGIYLERTDTAEVLAWEWGHTFITKGTLKNFKNSLREEYCYTIPFEDLRSLDELKARMV